MGIYAPQIKPYPALTIVPTAEPCPEVERGAFTREESAVPNKVRRNTSRIIRKTSDSDMYQPQRERYMKHIPSAVRLIIIVDISAARK